METPILSHALGAGIIALCLISLAEHAARKIWPGWSFWHRREEKLTPVFDQYAHDRAVERLRIAGRVTTEEILRRR